KQPRPRYPSSAGSASTGSAVWSIAPSSVESGVARVPPKDTSSEEWLLVFANGDTSPVSFDPAGAREGSEQDLLEAPSLAGLPLRKLRTSFSSLVPRPDLSAATSAVIRLNCLGADRSIIMDDDEEAPAPLSVYAANKPACPLPI
ncbi:hypothetical protein HDZ31DRAFT_20133, partial [Schizophyllum fasciatum]